jgi:hypothetical protein
MDSMMILAVTEADPARWVIMERTTREKRMTFSNAEKKKSTGNLKNPAIQTRMTAPTATGMKKGCFRSEVRYPMRKISVNEELNNSL